MPRIARGTLFKNFAYLRVLRGFFSVKTMISRAITTKATKGGQGDAERSPGQRNRRGRGIEGGRRSAVKRSSAGINGELANTLITLVGHHQQVA